MTAAEATLPDDGIIIMIAGCRDGHGGVGFYHNIADVKDPEEFEQKAIHTPRLETVPDQWTSQILPVSWHTIKLLWYLILLTQNS